MIIVSKPVNIQIEIKDESTGCSYILTGRTIKDCIDYFESLFCNKKEYKILWTKNISNK